MDQEGRGITELNINSLMQTLEEKRDVPAERRWERMEQGEGKENRYH